MSWLIERKKKLLMARGGGYPSVTLGSVDIGGNGVYGYAASGGFADSLGLGTGGTLSSTLLPGFTTTDVVDSGEGVTCVFSGNATAALASVTKLKINGTDYTFDPPYQSGGRTLVTAPTASLSAGTYTVQLV